MCLHDSWTGTTRIQPSPINPVRHSGSRARPKNRRQKIACLVRIGIAAGEEHLLKVLFRADKDEVVGRAVQQRGQHIADWSGTVHNQM